MSVINYLKNEFLPQLFAFLVVVAMIVGILAVLVYSNVTLSDNERIFQRNVMAHHHEALKEQNIHSVEIFDFQNSGLWSGSVCSISVTITVDGQKVTDDFLSDKPVYRNACRKGFSKLKFQGAFMGVPEVYRADIDPELIMGDNDDAVDLGAIRDLRTMSDKLLPKIAEFAQAMRSEYESLSLDDI